MGENYIEQLIKQNMTGKTMFKVAGLVAAVLASFVVSLVVPFLIILPAVAILVAIYFGKRFSCVEFEYIYYNGELDIDCISGKESRKRLISISAKDMEIIAPTGSSALSPYQNLKVYDCSTNSGAHTYEVVAKKVVTGSKKKSKGTEGNEPLVRVVFEPKKEILDGMRLFAPRKVML